MAPTMTYKEVYSTQEDILALLRAMEDSGHTRGAHLFNLFNTFIMQQSEYNPNGIPAYIGILNAKIANAMQEIDIRNQRNKRWQRMEDKLDHMNAQMDRMMKEREHYEDMRRKIKEDEERSMKSRMRETWSKHKWPTW